MRSSIKIQNQRKTRQSTKFWYNESEHLLRGCGSVNSIFSKMKVNKDRNEMLFGILLNV